MFVIGLLLFILKGNESVYVSGMIGLGIFFGLMSLFVDILMNAHIKDMKLLKLSPRYLYDNTKMNIISCAIICYVIFIVDDLAFIIIGMTKFLYWVTHIGREEEKK